MRSFYPRRPGKLLTLFALALLGWSGLAANLQAQQDLLSNSLLGREFWLAIPPMIGDPSDVNPEDLMLMVTPIRDTRVRVEVNGVEQERNVLAKKTEVFTLTNSGLRNDWQVNESEVALPQGIHVTSDEPMAVTMFNGRNRAGEAFQALPANKLGYRYRHMGYYDRNFGPQQKRAGGFIIVATRNGTEVNIELDGIGEGKTEGGHDFIDPEIEVSLNRGDVYMVRGEGEAIQGSYDISGTLIEASHPVAVIAFHQQINVPAAAATAATGGLSEMLPPINTWGKTYIALAWQEISAAQVTHYRVTADQKFTEILVRSFNSTNGQLIEQKNANLIDAGDFRAFEDIDPWANPGAYLRDLTVWTSNKPFYLMQYSGGNVWQEARPHMSSVPSVDQLVNSTMFVTPSEAYSSKRNRVHMIAESLPDNAELSPFTAIRINGEALTDAQPTLFATQVPGTGYWWATFNLEPGKAYTLDGDVKFNGILYGQFQWGSFSHPIAMGFNDLEGYDVLEPEISFERECSSVIITAKEVRNGNAGDDPRQEDSGIADVGIIAEESMNARIEYITPPNVLGFEGVTQFEFRIRAIDPTQPVTARVQVLDRAGNLALETIEIEASSELLELSRSRDDFGDVRIGVEARKTIVIENPTAEALEVTGIELVYNVVTPFEIIDMPDLPLTIGSGDDLPLEVRYIPKREDVGDRPDSVIVRATTACNVFDMGKLFGSGVQSKITVTELWEAETTQVLGESCNDLAGIRVNNDGTATLTITAIEVDSDQFNLDNLSVTLPAKVNPNSGLSIRGMCFAPTVEGEHEVVARFIIDDGGGEQPYASRWTGTAAGMVDDVRDPALPGYALFSATPNPVVSGGDGAVALRYALGRPGQARLNVYDALGNRILTLVDEFQSAGEHSVNFNTTALAPGVYSYRLEAGQFNAAEQFVVVR